MFQGLSPRQHRTAYHGPYLRNRKNLCLYTR